MENQQENNQVQNISNESQQSQPQFEASWSLKIMFGYLYYTEGVINAIAGTMPFIYPQLPDYITLSLFSLSSLPFSLKFITAPFIERYTDLWYGKRKTWVIIGQFLTGILLILISFFTQQDQARFFATMFIFIYFFISLQDIALDGLCLKQLRSPSLMSTIQAACQGTGGVLTSLILLKFTSKQFANSIGLQNPITSVQTLIIILGALFFFPAFIIHYKFKETFLESEVRSSYTSIFRVISYYRVYLKPSYTYFRRIIFLIFYYQGFNFFLAGYNYQLIERGFSRDTMNTIDNINSIITNLLLFFIGTKASIMGRKKGFMIQLILMMLVLVYLWIWFPTEVIPIAIVSFIVSFLASWDFLLQNQTCADFPSIGLTSMYFTMHASAANLGKMTFIHTAVLDKFPWKNVALMGLILQVILIIALPKAYDVVQEGESSIDSFYPGEEEQEENQLQIQNSPHNSS